MSVHSGNGWENVFKIAYSIVCGLTVTLTFDFWPRNLISSSVSPTAPKLLICWNSHERFIRHRVNKLLVFAHGRTHGHPKDTMPSGTILPMEEAWKYVITGCASAPVLCWRQPPGDRKMAKFDPSQIQNP